MKSQFKYTKSELFQNVSVILKVFLELSPIRSWNILPPVFKQSYGEFCQFQVNFGEPSFFSHQSKPAGVHGASGQFMFLKRC